MNQNHFKIINNNKKNVLGTKYFYTFIVEYKHLNNTIDNIKNDQ